MNNGKIRAHSAETLAKLVKRSTGVVITPEQLTTLLQIHWTEVSYLAHSIHNVDCGGQFTEQPRVQRAPY